LEGKENWRHYIGGKRGSGKEILKSKGKKKTSALGGRKKNFAGSRGTRVKSGKLKGIPSKWTVLGKGE